MASTPSLREVSKAISHALRHEPWLYELELDAEGWVGLNALVASLQTLGPKWLSLREQDILRAVERSDKRRHEVISGRIRAIYGHSISGLLKKSPALPPELLFHGTSLMAISDIRKEGLRPMGRQYVHLSSDEETAVSVGKRKTNTPVILRVRAGRASQDGVAFYIGNEKVWLADRVPPEYLIWDGLSDGD